MRQALLLPLLCLAACAANPAQPVAAEPAPNGDSQMSPAAPSTCRSDALAAFTGRQRSAALATEMLKVTGAKTIRWVGPGEMVTMDFRDDRLTVYLDTAGRVERAGCN